MMARYNRSYLTLGGARQTHISHKVPEVKVLVLASIDDLDGVEQRLNVLVARKPGDEVLFLPRRWELAQQTIENKSGILTLRSCLAARMFASVLLLRPVVVRPACSETRVVLVVSEPTESRRKSTAST